MKVKSYDPLQPGYEYVVHLDAPYDSRFKPDYTPGQCLTMGIFGGAYFREYPKFLREFPHLEHNIEPRENPDVNYYGVSASMTRRQWQLKGWMHPDDPRGWFQWYCRYDWGRRHIDDDRQINRWVRFKERKMRGYLTDKTKQGLLHWGINANKS